MTEIDYSARALQTSHERRRRNTLVVAAGIAGVALFGGIAHSTIENLTVPKHTDLEVSTMQDVLDGKGVALNGAIVLHNGVKVRATPNTVNLDDHSDNVVQTISRDTVLTAPIEVSNNGSNYYGFIPSKTLDVSAVPSAQELADDMVWVNADVTDQKDSDGKPYAQEFLPSSNANEGLTIQVAFKEGEGILRSDGGQHLINVASSQSFANTADTVQFLEAQGFIAG
jgi:hypothetical protein